MGTGADLRDRLWRERLVTALRIHLPAELDEAETLAGLILRQGVPPGLDESAVRAAVLRVPDATPQWVEQVMRIVLSVRDGLRQPIAEPGLQRSADQPTAPNPIRLIAPPPERPINQLTGSAPPELLPQSFEPAQREPSVPFVEPPLRQTIPTDPYKEGAASPQPDQALLMALILERLRAVSRFQQVAPQVQGTQNALRTLRIAVSAESDDSVRLPHLLAEWLEARRTWETQNQVLQSAHSTLRATEWLIPFLQWPQSKTQ